MKGRRAVARRLYRRAEVQEQGVRQGLAIDHETDVTDEGLIEDRFDDGLFVGRPLRLTPDRGSLGRWETRHISALGLIAEPVAIDDFGCIPDDLERVLRTRVAACILTPRAQNPTGTALDERRAHDLRKLFDSHGEVLVIEDDHAGPVAGVPALTVCHRKKERWAVIRSVSKSLGPDLRLAVVAGDATTIARVEGRQQLGAGWVSHILQGLVEALWTDPTTAERLRAAADAYTARRTALIAALAHHNIPARGRSGLVDRLTAFNKTAYCHPERNEGSRLCLKL